MDPFSIAAIVSTISTVASTAMGLVANDQSRMAQQAQASYQAAVARRDAEQARMNAAAETQKGGVAAQDQDFQNAILMDQQIANQAGSGFGFESGSRAAQRRQNKVLAGLDRERTYGEFEANATREMMRADALDHEAELATGRIASIGRAADMNNMSTLITGAGQVAKSFASFDGNMFGGGTPRRPGGPAPGFSLPSTRLS